MGGFFDYDNRVWRFVGKFKDLFFLNVLWLVCSIPVVTIGASSTAVYYVTLKLVRDEEGYTVRSFIKSFKENLRQATVLWLLLLLTGCILSADFFFFIRVYREQSVIRGILLSVLMVIALLYASISLYVFPLQSRFCNPVRRTLLNSFFISIRHLPYTIGMLCMDVILILSVFLIPPLLIIWVLFGFPMIAFVNSYLLVRILEKYMPKEDTGFQEGILTDED